jgi:hypothetical protein
VEFLKPSNPIEMKMIRIPRRRFFLRDGIVCSLVDLE